MIEPGRREVPQEDSEMKSQLSRYRSARDTVAGTFRDSQALSAPVNLVVSLVMKARVTSTRCESWFKRAESRIGSAVTHIKIDSIEQ